MMFEFASPDLNRDGVFVKIEEKEKRQLLFFFFGRGMGCNLKCEAKFPTTSIALPRIPELDLQPNPTKPNEKEKKRNEIQGG